MKFLIIIPISLLLSCANSKLTTGTYQKEIESQKFLFNSKIGLKIKYYGDYRFKKLYQRTTPKFDRKLAKNVRETKPVKKLYDAYTFVDPYVSSKCYWYKKSDLLTVKKARSSFLKNEENTTFTEQEVGDSEIVITQLKYTYPNSEGDSIGSINFCEYLFDSKEGVGSIIFWSTNNINWLERESLGVMKTMSYSKSKNTP